MSTEFSLVILKVHFVGQLAKFLEVQHLNLLQKSCLLLFLYIKIPRLLSRASINLPNLVFANLLSRDERNLFTRTLPLLIKKDLPRLTNPLNPPNLLKILNGLRIRLILRRMDLPILRKLKASAPG